MEEQILKILKKELRIVHGHTEHIIHGEIRSCEKITSHVMEFIQWTGMNCEGSPLSEWVLFDSALKIIAEFHSSEEMYQYWRNNVKK